MIRRVVEKSLRNMFERGYKQGYENALKENKGAFEGMTNGEVLKSIFPTAELILSNSDYIPDVLCVKEEWWNAPYKAESEGE